MKIDTLGVQAFVAIADRGSFQSAAESLHVTQTAITQRLRKLETYLGVTLIERTTRSMALTEIGLGFLPQARRLLGELADTLVEIRETVVARHGDVSMACVPTVGVQYLPRILQAYATRYPHNRIRIPDHALSAVEAAVLRREVEFGINIQGEHHPDLTSVPLTEDRYRYVLICHEDHPLAKRKRIAWRQLQSYPLIFAGEVSGNRALLDMALETSGVSLRSFYEVQRSSTAVGLVAQGVGVAVVPALALQEGARIPPYGRSNSRGPWSRVRWCWSRGKTAQLSPAAQALYDMIVGQRTLAK
ncbi:MAG: Transcriptional regulator YbhD, LysR family [uncultured Paraburkholderia sp.]|nr:MAG: Transcriptional regulator YbhD, LysR family [uncultured Paraburkholderia sp.]CAH2911342.1 MAG: Transcriptional regulator YbhD, LysR family [uncultured Paraburkholderia sp.]